MVFLINIFWELCITASPLKYLSLYTVKRIRINVNTTMKTKLLLLAMWVSAASVVVGAKPVCAAPADSAAYVSPYPAYTADDVTTAWHSFVYQYQDACTTKKIFSAHPRVDATNKKTLAAIWVQAIYLDMAMNRYGLTQAQADKDFVGELLAGNYNHYAKFDFDDENQETGWFIYDDIMWWTGALTRASVLLGKEEGARYLAYAEQSYHRVLFGSATVGDPGSWDQQKGGMFWNWAKPAGQGWDKRDNGKAACINFPTVVAAVSLYRATGKEAYFTQAKAIYAWAREHLIRPDGYVFDMFHAAPNGHDNLYNSGTAIGAAACLYLQTKEQHYLDDALRIADYVKNVKCAPTHGYLPVRYGEEQGIYAAIFAQYMRLLIDDCGQDQYLPWLRYNINAGWANRNRTTHITCPDFSVTLTDMRWEYTEKGKTQTKPILSYDASAIPALMLVIPPQEE